jgi:hypothetical protein
LRKPVKHKKNLFEKAKPVKNLSTKSLKRPMRTA